MNHEESLDNDVKLGEMLAEIRHKIDRLEKEVADNDRKWQMLINKVAAMRNAANQESDSELVKALATIEGYIAMLEVKNEKDRDEFIGQTQWCDVDEALPIPGEYVLLSFANYPVPMVGRYEEDEDGGGNFYVGDDDVPLVKQDVFVNAWRLLPKCMEE